MFRRLLAWLGLISTESIRSFEWDADLRASLQDLAIHEQRPVEEVAQDLLHQALLARQAEREIWRCWEDLTPRQQEVAALICLDYTSQQISARLNVTPNTIKSHIRQLLKKLGVHNRQELRKVLEEWDFSAWE